MQRFYPNHPYQQMQHHPQQQQRQGPHERHPYPPHMQHPAQSQQQWQNQGPHNGQAIHENAFMPQPPDMQRQISIEDAIRIGREQVPGQVVKVELERKSGRLIYEVDVINQQGVKYEVKIDANSGAVLEVELD